MIGSGLMLCAMLAAAPEGASTLGPNAFHANVGLASAVGVVGITYERDLAPVLQLELGLGFGFTGAQFSLMPKLLFGDPRARWVTGLGLSVSVPGAERYTDSTTPATRPHVVTPWLNIDAIGFEKTTDHGTDFLIAAGVAVCLAHGQYKVFDDGSPGELFGLTVPQLRVAFGPRF